MSEGQAGGRSSAESNQYRSYGALGAVNATRNWSSRTTFAMTMDGAPVSGIWRSTISLESAQPTAGMVSAFDLLGDQATAGQAAGMEILEGDAASTEHAAQSSDGTGMDLGNFATGSSPGEATKQPSNWSSLSKRQRARWNQLQRESFESGRDSGPR